MRVVMQGWIFAGMPGETKVYDHVSAVPVLTIPFSRGNLADLRPRIADLAGRAGLEDHRIDDLLVVATELATNAVRHAGGSGVLRLWTAGDSLYCQVIDEGPGLPNPQRAGVRPVPTTSDEGRGLWLARQLSDELYLVAGRNGTSATAAFAIS